MPSTLQPGAELAAGCRAWRRLGAGARCETWLAWSEPLWAPVVVKLPLPDQREHPRARRSLAREAAALAGAQHPALPRLYVDGSLEAVPHVVLEHVDGPALDDEIDAHGAFDAAEVVLLGAALLAGLRLVHARGRAHTDVKPENVVLRDGRPVLIDFGSSRRLAAAQPAGRLIGSPGYAAPELEAGAPISAAMDVFGVGVTLREALTGDYVFEPELPAARRPALEPLGPLPLHALVDRMTQVEPERRPGVDEALRALTRLAGDTVAPAWA